jgi:hypothetical protein
MLWRRAAGAVALQERGAASEVLRDASVTAGAGSGNGVGQEPVTVLGHRASSADQPLTTRPEADADRIGVLGICASRGYALSATGGDQRVKAVATVSVVDIARQFRLGAEGSQDPALFRSMLDAAAQARTAAARGEDPGTLPLFPGTVEEARELGGEHGAEGFDYYCTRRARHPRSAAFFDSTSIDRTAAFDAFASVPHLARSSMAS